MSATYKVEGMTCQGCVRSLTSAIQAVEENAQPAIDLDAGTLSVEGMDEATVLKVVEDAGFDFAGKV